MPSLIKDYATVREALITAATQYQSTDNTHKTGLIHGEAGENRAENLKNWATACSTQNEEGQLRLFALLYAVMAPNYSWLPESRSNYLALCVANALIQGDYINTCLFIPQAAEATENKKSLITPALCDDAVARSKMSACVRTTYGHLGYTETYDKRAGLRSMLFQARADMDPTAQKTLDQTVNDYKKTLTGRNDPTIEMANWSSLPPPVVQSEGNPTADTPSHHCL
jgi:hypothetical protein